MSSEAIVTYSVKVVDQRSMNVVIETTVVGNSGVNSTLEYLTELSADDRRMFIERLAVSGSATHLSNGNDHKRFAIKFTKI